MTPLIRILLLLVPIMGFIGNASHSQGEENEDGKAAWCARLVKASGIEVQLKSIPRSLLSVIPADIFPDVRTRTRIESLYLKRLGHTDPPGHCLMLSLSRSLHQGDVSELLGFYESRIGRKVVRLHEGSLDPWRLREIREGYKRVTILEEPRLSFMKRFARNRSFSSTNVEWTRAVVGGLMAGYVKDSPAESAAVRDVSKIIEYGTNTAREKSEEMRMLSVTNTFAALSDAELSEVATFYESEAAVKMQEATGPCIKAALFHAAWTLGNCFREETAPRPRTQ